MKVVATFSGRTDAMVFYNELLSKGVRANMINSQSTTNSGCSVSVAFQYENLTIAKNIISRRVLRSFTKISKYL